MLKEKDVLCTLQKLFSQILHPRLHNIKYLCFTFDIKISITKGSDEIQEEIAEDIKFRMARG